eukprot:m.23346 g.23346  ORF g.23346 m.23346 type:complete len:224 (-) comp11367_c0_seq6:73-744(-)
MRANVIAFSLLTIFLAVLGLVPDMPWLDVKLGNEEVGFISLFQECEEPVKIDASDDDYSDDDLSDDDGAGAPSAFKKAQTCLRFRNNLPKGLDKPSKKLLEMRDGVVISLAMMVVLSAIAFIAGACDAIVVAIVFFSLSVVFGLTAIGCAVEMREALKKSSDDSSDDGDIDAVVNFHVGFYLTVLATLVCLVGAITTTVTRKPSRPRHIVFANPNSNQGVAFA